MTRAPALVKHTILPNFVCSQPGTPRLHYIDPLPCGESPQRTFARVREVLEQMPRTVILEDTGEYLHALCRSRIFRFPDDLKCLLCAREGVIHVGSKARFGIHDLGVNRERVETLRRMLQGS